MEKGFLVFTLSLIFMISFVAASQDVAYIVKNPERPDTAFIGAFNDLGLNVELIDDDEAGLIDFSEYDFVFVGDERFRNDVSGVVNENPAVIANGYYGEEFGLTNSGGISQLASNSPLNILRQGEKIQVYTQADFKLGGVSIPYYYLPFKYKNEHVQTVATTAVGYETELGDVISYSSDGANKCFFGITHAKFWTDDAKDLFEDCVDYVLGGGVIPGEEKHDIEIVADYTNSLNGIRIKDIESGEYLLEPLAILGCGKQYKVDYKTMNIGDYIEDIELHGVLGDVAWQTTKDDLAPGSYTTAGSKTITIELDPDYYSLEISAEIIGFADDDDSNNIRSRNVFVTCEGVEPPTGEGWYCADDGEIRDDCVGLSSGLGTRCYLDEGHTTWETCSSGWVEL